MNILTISGSAKTNSTNVQLLEAIPAFFPNHKFKRFDRLEQLPLFHADCQGQPYPEIIKEWQNEIATTDAVIISTPEYIFNIPAILKNAFEWVTESGEFYEKKVLAITYLPNAPRGQKAMQSLIWTLQALKTTIVAQLPLYHNELKFENEGKLIDSPSAELLREAVGLFENG